MTENQKNISDVTYPELLNVSPSPHIKNSDTTASVMLRVIIALIPDCIWGVYRFGARAGLILLLSTASAVLFEWAYQMLMKKKVAV